MAMSGHIRSKILGSDRTDPIRLDLSEIPGGAEAFERAVNFCYGVNFEITVDNVAVLRCVAEYLEMTERVCDGNLTERTEEFLAQAALKTLSDAVTVLKSCEGLGELAEEIGLVRRCVDVVSLKAHPGLDEIEQEKVCSVIDPLRLSYEARLHVSQNKRLPLQVVLHALYYDQLKLRSGETKEPATSPLLSASESARSRVSVDVSIMKENEKLRSATSPLLSASESARRRASMDVSIMKENEKLRSELTRMKLYLSDLEKKKKVGKKPTFFTSVSKTLGKLNPFKQASKDTLDIDHYVKVDVQKRRRFSVA